MTRSWACVVLVLALLFGTGVEAYARAQVRQREELAVRGGHTTRHLIVPHGRAGSLRRAADGGLDMLPSTGASAAGGPRSFTTVETSEPSTRFEAPSSTVYSARAPPRS